MIFVSHNDKPLGGEIKVELEQWGYECFLAHDDIPAGSDWDRELWTVLTGCDMFIGIITPTYAQSPYCQQEVGAAIAMDKLHLMVKTDQTDPPGFAKRWQAIHRPRLVHTLDTAPAYRRIRVLAWIKATKDATSYDRANDVYKHFQNEWDTMNDSEKLSWLLAAAGSGEVSSEKFHVGPFFHACK